jgi:outer membrane lipoprotein-sorting protein
MMLLCHLAGRRLARALVIGLCAGFLYAAPPAGAGDRVQTAALSPDEVAAITRVERYLNDIRTMQARFVQVSSNGAYAEGEVFLERPGHLRFDYDPPTPVLMIANGLTLLYYDKELKEATFLPLWETPLWFLIREEVRLDENVEIVAIEEALGALRITLRDIDTPDGGAVTLVFSDEPLALKKWELTDPQGIQTQVSLINPVFGGAIDSELFKYGDLEVYNKRNNTDR